MQTRLRLLVDCGADPMGANLSRVEEDANQLLIMADHALNGLKHPFRSGRRDENSLDQNLQRNRHIDAVFGNGRLRYAARSRGIDYSSYFSLVCKTRSFMKKRRKRIIFGDKLLLIVEVVDLSDEDGAICIRNKCSLQAVKCGSYSCSDRLRGAAASNVAYKCGLTA